MAKKTALESLLGEMFTTVEENERHERAPAISNVEAELKRYIQSPAPSMSLCPFIWWKTNHTNFPYLAKLANKLLIIQATSVSSERAFSTTGDIVSEKRSRLDAKFVDKLVFLNKNHCLLPSKV